VLRRLALIPLICLSGLALAENKDFHANLAFSSLSRHGRDNVDVKALEQSASLGNVATQAELARLLYFGRDVPQDLGAAYEWAKKAVDQGNTKAMILMAEMYLGGHGVPKDEQRAFAFAGKAADLGDPAGLGFNAVQYVTGMGVPRDVDRGKKMLADAVGKGDINSMVALGILDASADVPDYKTAEALFTKAAQAGDAAGQLCLGLLYEAEKRFPEAQPLIRQAADQTYGDADKVLGFYLHWGRAGFAVDQRSAALYLSLAAAQGDLQSAGEIGAMYYLGQGIPQDKQTGTYWLRRAAAAGDQRARDLLAQAN
jgi:TPR repeat protein